VPTRASFFRRERQPNRLPSSEPTKCPLWNEYDNHRSTLRGSFAVPCHLALLFVLKDVDGVVPAVAQLRGPTAVHEVLGSDRLRRSPQRTRPEWREGRDEEDGGGAPQWLCAWRKARTTTGRVKSLGREIGDAKFSSEAKNSCVAWPLRRAMTPPSSTVATDRSCYQQITILKVTKCVE
jgi:hypothetical protein